MFTKKYVRRVWTRRWCTMIGKNMFACLRDTASGIDAQQKVIPARILAARTGPPLSREVMPTTSTTW